MTFPNTKRVLEVSLFLLTAALFLGCEPLNVDPADTSDPKPVKKFSICPACKGNGHFNLRSGVIRECESCGGRGRIERVERIDSAKVIR